MSLIARTQSQAGHLAYRARFPADRRSMSRSATRALDVLELFGEARRELRAVEIAVSLGISRSSANQLLLQNLGGSVDWRVETDGAACKVLFPVEEFLPPA